MSTPPDKAVHEVGIRGVVALLVLATSASGQDALRSTIEGDRAYQTRSTGEFLPVEEGLRTGPVHYSFSLGYALEWNDNVRYSAFDAQDDFIHSPQANLRMTWPATRDSVLSFGMGVGYRKYTDNNDLDRLFIAPDSELAWDIPAKDWVFTVYDRFHYSQDVISQGALSGTAEFPRMENTAGLRARWMPGRYVVQAGYGHYNFFSQSGDYDYLSRSSEQVFARAGYRFAEATQTGLEISGGITDYESGVQSDNRSLSVGPYIDWQITEATTVSLRGGYVMYRYDPSAVNPTSRDLSSWYLGARMENRLTDRIRQSLEFSHDIQQGLNRGSEYIELSRVSYAVSWGFVENFTLTGNAYYEHSQEPSSNPLLRPGETYDRYGVGAALRWQMQRHLSAALAYRFDDRQSDDSTRDYTANSIILSIAYRF